MHSSEIPIIVKIHVLNQNRKIFKKENTDQE